MMLPAVSSLLAQADLPPVAPEPGTFWMPPQASTHAQGVDAVFYFILAVSIFFFILIVALMLVFMVRYRARTRGAKATSRVTHNTPLELTWTAIPLILVVIMFLMGFRTFMDMANPPQGAMDIRVLGYKWAWAFTYPNGHVDAELHVPVDTPVRLILESSDVIHSMYIPAFRIKKDAVPGRYNKAWFHATQPGEYLMLCAEYCGTKHSDMLTRVVVHEPGRFEKWLADASDPFKEGKPLWQVGEMLARSKCSSCHSVDGTANVGPTFKDIYEQEHVMADGETVLVEDNYIRESIEYPQRKIRQGYGREMPSFKGLLKDREITAIIEYIKHLSGKTTMPAEGAADETDAASSTQPAETEQGESAETGRENDA